MDRKLVHCSIIALLLANFCFILHSEQRNNYVTNSDTYSVISIAPDTLSINYFLGSKKYRNIHHDSFCRDANRECIGNNALSNRPEVLGYKTMSMGSVSVGISIPEKSQEQLMEFFRHTRDSEHLDDIKQDDVRRYNHYASNFSPNGIVGWTIKYIDTDRSSYHAVIIRADDETSDSKFAFFISDINNFYYVRISHKVTEIGHYSSGEKTNLVVNKGGKELEVFINGRDAKIIVDGIYMNNVKTDNQPSQLCGLLFDNFSVSNVDEFIVDYIDEYQDAGIDIAVENNNIENGVFGHYCAFENRCTVSTDYVNKWNKSFKFTLTKPKQDEVIESRNKATHSTIMLNGIVEKGGNDYRCARGGNKPLDSFVFSADVFFPNEGSEKWQLDEHYGELFIQEHHVGWPIPFSPSISININRGRLLLNTIWQESIPVGSTARENPTTTRNKYFGRINTAEEEQYLASKGFLDFSSLPELKKGEWHNFTLYVKLGYTFGQKPRTILYVDNKKMIDWNTPNAYNCQEYGEYLEFGIYKWDWENPEKRNKTPIKKRVIYFDNIHYYI